MNETITASPLLKRWQGDRGTYHLVTITGVEADAIATHATLHRMEFGRQRGFGSVKVMARIGDTEWKTSVFPMKIDDMKRQTKHWTLLISKKVMRAEGLSEGNPVAIELELL